MEYLFVMYESIAEFNRYGGAKPGWSIKDFRVIESNTHVNGLLVCWQRERPHQDMYQARHKVELRSDGEWPK